MQIHSYGLSDIGRTRNKNEDAFLLDEANGTFAVADGLGGLPEGALASQGAISKLQEAIRAGRKAEELERIFFEINDHIVGLGRKISPDTGIGTTLTAALVAGETLNIAHVGDSALYRFNESGTEKLTIDHTLEQEIRNRPDYNPRIPIPRRHSHVLTRCLGQIDDLEIDLYTHPIAPGDRLILCSDGVTLAIDPEEIHKCILAATSPETAARELIDLANERGGRDNATLIALFVE